MSHKALVFNFPAPTNSLEELALEMSEHNARNHQGLNAALPQHPM